MRCCTGNDALHLLGVRFDRVATSDVLDAINCWRASGSTEYIVLANPHSVLTADRDEDFRDAIEGAALTIADGAGISLAARIFGVSWKRLPGPTLMLDVFNLGRGDKLRHFLYGGSGDVLQKLRSRLERTFPGAEIVGALAPPFRHPSTAEDEEIIRYINCTHPDVVWVALGTGKQEKWMRLHVGRVQAPALIGVGAAFNFHAGDVPWAPGWVRRLGLEWAYRLCHEPRRLWRRNLDSPVFLLRVLRERLHSHAKSLTHTCGSGGPPRARAYAQNCRFVSCSAHVFDDNTPQPSATEE